MTLMVSEADDVLLNAFFAEISTTKSPAAVGVPAITPVDVLMPSPPGRAVASNEPAHVAAIVYQNGVPTPPDAASGLVITGTTLWGSTIRISEFGEPAALRRSPSADNWKEAVAVPGPFENPQLPSVSIVTLSVSVPSGVHVYVPLSIPSWPEGSIALSSSSANRKLPSGNRSSTAELSGLRGSPAASHQRPSSASRAPGSSRWRLRTTTACRRR